MIFGGDMMLYGYDAGITGVSWSITGSATADADYPLANIWDDTSEQTIQDSLSPANYTLLNYTDSFDLTFDFGTAIPVRMCSIIGYDDVDADFTTPAASFSSIVLQYWTGAAWATGKAVTGSATSSGSHTLLNPEIFIPDTTQRTATKYRIRFIVTGGPVANSVRIGHIGLYAETDDMPIVSPAFDVTSNDSTAVNSRGVPSVISRTPTLLLSASQSSQPLEYTAIPTSVFSHFRDHSRGLPHLDFARYPAGLYFDEIDDGTAAAQAAQNNIGGHYLIQTGSTVIYNTLGTKVSYPLVATAWR